MEIVKLFLQPKPFLAMPKRVALIGKCMQKQPIIAGLFKIDIPNLPTIVRLKY